MTSLTVVKPALFRQLMRQLLKDHGFTEAQIRWVLNERGGHP